MRQNLILLGIALFAATSFTPPKPLPKDDCFAGLRGAFISPEASRRTPATTPTTSTTSPTSSVRPEDAALELITIRGLFEPLFIFNASARTFEESIFKLAHPSTLAIIDRVLAGETFSLEDLSACVADMTAYFGSLKDRFHDQYYGIGIGKRFKSYTLKAHILTYQALSLAVAQGIINKGSLTTGTWPEAKAQIDLLDGLTDAYVTELRIANAEDAEIIIAVAGYAGTR
ncbi:hypothetical protein FJ366_02550 [Candidatus Dependentiae bacterium]|nr:hypothetical protein [Candidatus Dependentiae bacterium]